jgi:hypothetical protein
MKLVAANSEGICVGSSTNAPADQWTHDVTIRNNVSRHDQRGIGSSLTYNCAVDGNTRKTNASDHYAAIEIDERDTIHSSGRGIPITWSGTATNMRQFMNSTETRAAYSNVVWNTAAGYKARVDNLNGDISHGTITTRLSTAAFRIWVPRLISATTSGRPARSMSLTPFCQRRASRLHLLAGTAPVNAGANHERRGNCRPKPPFDRNRTGSGGLQCVVDSPDS